MRQTALALIAVLLILPLAEGATPPDPHQQALALPREAKIEVSMANGDKLAGRLGEVGTDHFSLSMGKALNSQVREVAFSDVRSVKRAGIRTSTKVLLVVTGVIVVGVVIVVVYAAGNAKLPNPFCRVSACPF